MIPTFDATGLPNQSLTDKQILAEYGSFKNYYLRTAQHWAGFFYRPGLAQNSEFHRNGYFSEYQEIIRNMELFQGRQRTVLFSFLDQLSQGGFDGGKESPLPIQPGQDSASIMLFLQGVFLSIVSTAEPKAMVLNEDIRNKMTQKLKMVEVMRIFKDEMAVAQDLTGLQLKGQIDPSQPTEKVFRAVSDNFGTGIIRRANKLMGLIKQESMDLSDYARTYINTIAGRRGCLIVDENGLFKHIRPENYGSVSVEDDDFGKHDICRFYFDLVHTEEARQQYQKFLSPTEDKLLKNSSFVNQAWYSPLINRYPYQLFYPETKMMIRGTFFYKSALDSGYVIKKGEDHEIVQRQRKGRKGEIVSCMKKVVSLGNMFVADYGIYDTIEDPAKRGNKLFPIMAFQPNTFNGYSQSLADRLNVIQQNIDMAMNRMAENTMLSLGTIISILGDTLTDGEGVAEVYAKLREFRINIRHTSGIAGNPNDRIQGIQKEDMSLMGDVEQYMKYYQQMKAVQKEIANVNDVTMGTPTEYVGHKTQQGSIAQASNSYQYTMNGIIQLYSDAASFALEKKRQMVIDDPTNMKWITLLGEDGVQEILDDKEHSFSDWLASISVKDNLDPRRRAQLIEFMMKNPNTTLRDIIEVQDAPTITAIKDYADYMEDRTERRKQQAAAMQQAADAEKEAIRAEATIGGKEAQAAAMRGATKDKIVGKMVDRKMEQGVPDEDIAALIQGSMQE